ncbi:MAG: toprim domain-containing protein [Polyangiaceae bacterium]
MNITSRSSRPHTTSAHGESVFEGYKNEVRLRLSLRDLVEESHAKGLRPTGKTNIICCSPLREDKHPSFSVFEGGGGEYVAFDHATRESFDLYAYVMRKEGLDFVDAVRWCGDRVGLSWNEYEKQHGGGDGGRTSPPPGITEEEWDRAREKVLALDERQMVANAQQAMVDLCHSWFIRSKLVPYVEARWGIAEETQRRFMLGFVPHGFAGLLEELREHGAFPYSRKQLAKTGWFTFRSMLAGDPDPELRCIFDGRLLYPYLFRGKCRYACARIIYEDRIDPAYFERSPWEQAKFKKAFVAGPSHPSVSPFVQNDLLYNADNGFKSRTGFARLVIVEGPSDCMAMVEAGYDCVAPVATSIRSEDVPMLLEATAQYKEVVLATDTDVKPDGRRPGLEGALRMAPDLIAAGKRVKLLVFPLPPGESKVDPASWGLAWKQAGKEDDPFAELMANAPSVAAALVGFLDPDLTAAQLPEALNQIVQFARSAKSSKAQIEEIAKLVKDRLGSKFTRTAIKQAMGEADDRLEAAAKADAAARAAIQDDKILDIEGRVIERGGFDQPGKVRCYQGYAKDGSPITVSTFLLQPSRIIIGSNGDRLLEVSVHIETDTSLVERWVVPKLAWTSRRAFVSAFPHERMQFNGSDFNVHSVYQIVSERAARLAVPTVRGEPIVGLHQTAGGLRLVLPGETWNAEGVMENPDIVYASDIGSVSFCSMIRVDGAQDPAKVDSLVARLLSLLFELNDPVKLTTICAWIVGNYFLPEIRELGGKASILNVFGSPESGKTTLLKDGVSKMLQPFGSKFEPETPAVTRFATIRSLSWSNIFVSAFDEYRTSEAGGDFMRLLRTGFSGGSESRGSRDQSVRSYSLFGAVLLLGEQRADVDAAMDTRLVMVGLDKTTIETRNADVAVQEILATDERWRVATDILQWRMRVEPGTVHDWWAQAKRDAVEALGRMKLKVASRARDLCAEVAFRMRTWNEWLDHRAERHVMVPRPPLDAVLRMMLETTTGLQLPAEGGRVVSLSSKNLVVRALEMVTPYAVGGQFEEHRCYRLVIRSGRLLLAVHPGSLAATLAEQAKRRGQQDPTNGEAALKRAAKEEHERSGDTGWLISPSHPYRMGSADEVGEEQERPTRMRCWIIDVERAHEMVGLELDWPGTPGAWGGDRKKSAPIPSWRKPSGEGV